MADVRASVRPSPADDVTTALDQHASHVSQGREGTSHGRLTGPNASVEFDAQTDDLGVTAVRNKPNTTSYQQRIDLAHLRDVCVCVALEYLQTQPQHVTRDEVRPIHR